MNTRQKKALYESIMKNVAKTVKKSLNESTKPYNVKCFISDALGNETTEDVYSGSYFECLDFMFGGKENEDGFNENEAYEYVYNKMKELYHVKPYDIDVEEGEHEEERGRLMLVTSCDFEGEENEVHFVFDMK